MLAAYGLFVFELASFAPGEIDRRREFRHARSTRVGARDASQYVGPGEDTLSLAGAIVPEAGGSYGAIATLAEMAEEGDSWPFVTGAGEVFGSYVITRLDDRRRALLVDGTPRIVDFTLELARTS